MVYFEDRKEEFEIIESECKTCKKGKFCEFRHPKVKLKHKCIIEEYHA
ncbi:hypothetical protein HYU06_01515 [Candidatus Woesearchaeota archaeon]|nr:hypothetical protein [Candidatus Woesearchaeota archaeon]